MVMILFNKPNKRGQLLKQTSLVIHPSID